MPRALRLRRRMPDGVPTGREICRLIESLGVVLAHAERQMHQGKARRGTRHVVLALLEEKSSRRVADAEATLHLTLAGGASATTKLEPMTIAGQASYGGFVFMEAHGIYTLRFDIRRSGVSASAHAEFQHRYVPKVYWQATTRRVLTMDQSPGHRLGDEAPPPGIAQALMRLFLTQVFARRVPCGPASRQPLPAAGRPHLLPRLRRARSTFAARDESLRQLFLAVMARDASWVASAYLGMGAASTELDRAAFTQDLAGARPQLP